MQFAEALRKAMGGMTQPELAELSGVPQQSISSYLRGSKIPKLSNLEMLERVLPDLYSLRMHGSAAA